MYVKNDVTFKANTGCLENRIDNKNRIMPVNFFCSYSDVNKKNLNKLQLSLNVDFT